MALTLEAFGADLAWHDITQYIRYGSVVMRLNTFDVELIDLPTNLAWGGPVLTAAMRLNLQGWSGTITIATGYDLVDIKSGHRGHRFTATNTVAAVPGVTGLTFSDVPIPSLDDYLLEDGSGTYLLESGSFEDPGSYEMEGGTYGYQGLSLSAQQNLTDLTPTSLGRFRVFTPGLWPGATFNLISRNLTGTSSPTTYFVTQTAISFEGANPPTPVYDIEFSNTSITDTSATLQLWRTTG